MTYICGPRAASSLFRKGNDKEGFTRVFGSKGHLICFLFLITLHYIATNVTIINDTRWWMYRFSFDNCRFVALLFKCVIDLMYCYFQSCSYHWSHITIFTKFISSWRSAEYKRWMLERKQHQNFFYSGVRGKWTLLFI